MYKHSVVLNDETVGEFCMRHRMSRCLFFSINPELEQQGRVIHTGEGIRTVAMVAGERLRVVDEAAMANKRPELLSPSHVEPEGSASIQVASGDEEKESSKGFSGWTVFFSLLGGITIGSVATIYAAKNTFARGSSLKDFADQWRREGFGQAHEKFRDVRRSTTDGRLEFVNGHKVVNQRGPVFAYHDEGHNDYRAANIVTGQYYDKSYPTEEAIDADFKYDIVPALDHY